MSKRQDNDASVKTRVSPIQWLIYFVSFTVLLESYLCELTFLSNLETLLMKYKAAGAAVYLDLYENELMKENLEEVSTLLKKTQEEIKVHVSSRIEIKKQIEKLSNERDQMKIQFSEAQEIMTANEAKLQEEIIHLSTAIEKSQEKASDVEVLLNESKARNHYLTSETTETTRRIQERSRRSVLQKYGPSPHFVRIEISIPSSPQFGDAEMEGYLFIELADISIMPHSVELFLDMAKENMYDGFSISNDLQHILTILPRGEERRERFIQTREQINSSLVINEYSTEFLHRPLSIGFMGNPPGPLFYISKEDNTYSHGPGRTDENSIPIPADPCFGFIAVGQDTLELLTSLPKSGDEDFQGFPSIIRTEIMNLEQVQRSLQLPDESK